MQKRLKDVLVLASERLNEGFRLDVVGTRQRGKLSAQSV